MIRVTIDGVVQETTSGERLIDVINRAGMKISQRQNFRNRRHLETWFVCVVHHGFT